MMAKKEKSTWVLIIAMLLFLFLAASFISGILSLIFSADQAAQGNVAFIPITGVILTEQGNDFFGGSISDSSSIVKDIQDAAKDDSIKAIVLEINSPGGAPVASDEIARAVKESNKTTVAWVREIGTSGAYWVASASDHIIANRMSLTGSIGVIGSYLDFSGFLTDWNITYERLVAGKYKDVGTPLRQLTDEERQMLQRKLDLLHQEFKNAVQQNRKLSNSEIAAVSEGEFYLGSEAKDLNLVDELGGMPEVQRYLEKSLNITVEPAWYKHEPTLLELLSTILNERSFYFGLGYGQGQNLGMMR